MVGLEAPKKRVNEDEISDNVFKLIHPEFDIKLSEILNSYHSIHDL